MGLPRTMLVSGHAPFPQGPAVRETYGVLFSKDPRYRMFPYFLNNLKKKIAIEKITCLK